jgi:hypothetical protein
MASMHMRMISRPKYDSQICEMQNLEESAFEFKGMARARDMVDVDVAM